MGESHRPEADTATSEMPLAPEFTHFTITTRSWNK